MKKLLTFCLLTALMLILANFSSQSDDSKDSNENIYGTLTTIENKEYKIDRITISSMTKNIAVYAKPENEESNPASDITRLNLIDVKEINRGKHQLTIYKFKSREYVEFTVIWKDKQKKNDNFIIERNKQIIGYLTNGPKQRKEVSFEALSKLTIDGYKYKSDEECKN